MVIMSDNTATNLAIDRLGLDTINARIAWHGPEGHAPVQEDRQAGGGADAADQPKYGLGKTTPREMAKVMERIGRCELDKASGAYPGRAGYRNLRGRDEDAAKPVLPRH